MGTRLYVGNLSFNTTEGDLQRHFEQAGTVVDCTLIVDKFTSRSKGFGFVEMGSQEDADNAINMFNGQDMDGRPLTVNEARPREDRGGGGGGGGRRDYGGGGGGGGRGGRRDRY
jgi:RNA recognition motif-containing protein